jgi:thermosome
MCAAELAGTPVLILKEGSTRSRGREAQRANIMAARIIAEAIKSSLGPKGMDKMLVDSFGDVTITSDGRTVLDKMDVQHPAAKMMVEIAKTQDSEVGDGTTSAVIVAGELLEKAEDLIEKNVHPTIIIDGYRKAAEKALEALEKIAIETKPRDKKFLKKIAMTAMASKIVAEHREHLANIVVDAAVLRVTKEVGGKLKVDLDDIMVEKKAGKSLTETMLIKGIVLDKEVVHPGMPKRIENAKIALVNVPLEVEKTEMDAKIFIEKPEEMEAFLKEEENIMKEMVDKIAATGANVVICQKGIDNLVQHFLARKGILAVRRAKQSDMEKLAKATGGRIVTNLDDLKAKDLGYAKLVEERKIGDDKMIFVEQCKNPRSVAILIRAGLERMVDEAERALHDALSVVSDVIENNKIVAGGGAVESELTKALREYGPKVGGREQLAIEAFADALEVVPKTLAENAGLDPIDILVELRAAHQKPRGVWMGVDVFTGKVVDMHHHSVLEPLSVKEQAIKSAAEAASMILRIDDVIAAGKPKEEEKEKEEKGPPGEEFGEY